MWNTACLEGMLGGCLGTPVAKARGGGQHAELQHGSQLLRAVPEGPTLVRSAPAFSPPYLEPGTKLFLEQIND